MSDAARYRIEIHVEQSGVEGPVCHAGQGGLTLDEAVVRFKRLVASLGAPASEDRHGGEVEAERA